MPRFNEEAVGSTADGYKLWKLAKYDQWVSAFKNALVLVARRTINTRPSEMVQLVMAVGVKHKWEAIK